jgi:ABC-type transporter Mla MlaB component
VGRNWSAVFQQLKRSAPDKIVVDASALKNLDGAGIAFLLSIQRTQEESNRSFEIIHLKPSFQQLLEDSTLEGLAVASAPPSSFFWTSMADIANPVKVMATAVRCRH